MVIKERKREGKREKNGETSRKDTSLTVTVESNRVEWFVLWFVKLSVVIIAILRSRSRNSGDSTLPGTDKYTVARVFGTNFRCYQLFLFLSSRGEVVSSERNNKNKRRKRRRRRFNKRETLIYESMARLCLFPQLDLVVAGGKASVAEEGVEGGSTLGWRSKKKTSGAWLADDNVKMRKHARCLARYEGRNAFYSCSPCSFPLKAKATAALCI